MNLSHLHSFSICSGCLKMPPTFHLPCLRVLDLEGCGSFKNVDLNCILRLFHLRYLGFRGTSGVMLPVQVWNLHYLQTLDVNGTGVTRLPESTIHLKRLMRLVGQGLIMPDGFGNMESLEDLGSLDGRNCSINFGEDLALLSKLRVLQVRFLGGVRTSNGETRK